MGMTHPPCINKKKGLKKEKFMNHPHSVYIQFEVKSEFHGFIIFFPTKSLFGQNNDRLLFVMFSSFRSRDVEHKHPRNF